MATITRTAAQVSMLDPIKARIRSYEAVEAIEPGQAVYVTTAGKAGLASANTGGKEQFRGIALNKAGAGFAVDVLEDGDAVGFDVSGLDVDALIYLGNTAGTLDTAAGSTSVAAGRVINIYNKPLFTKAVKVFVKWDADWS